MRLIQGMLIKFFVIACLLMAAPVCAGVDFDITDDSVNTGDSSVWDFGTGDYTFCMWIFPETVTNGSRQQLFSKDSSTGRQFALQLNGDGASSTRGAITIAHFDTDSTFAVYDTGVDEIVANVWQHICLTKSGNSPDPYSCYIDGSSVSITKGGGDDFPRTMQATSTDLLIGARVYSGFAEPFDGIITDVSAWDAALTSDEVSLLYTSKLKRMPLQVRPSNLIAYWPLDDVADGTSADGEYFEDMSSNNLDALGDDGSNNTGLTAKAEELLSYP